MVTTPALKGRPNPESSQIRLNLVPFGSGCIFFQLNGKETEKYRKASAANYAGLIPERSEFLRKGSLNRIPLLPKALKRMCKNMHTDPNGANLRRFWDGAD